MSKIIPGSTSLEDAKKAKDSKRMTLKNAGFTDGGNSLITVKQHEMLMVAALEAYDRKKNDEIFEYVEYRLSVRGCVMAYRRLWEVRVARVLIPIVGLLKRYREIQQRKRERAGVKP